MGTPRGLAGETPTPIARDTVRATLPFQPGHCPAATHLPISRRGRSGCIAEAALPGSASSQAGQELRGASRGPAWMGQGRSPVVVLGAVTDAGVGGAEEGTDSCPAAGG